MSLKRILRDTGLIFLGAPAGYFVGMELGSLLYSYLPQVNRLVQDAGILLNIKGYPQQLLEFAGIFLGPNAVYHHLKNKTIKEELENRIYELEDTIENLDERRPKIIFLKKEDYQKIQ